MSQRLGTSTLKIPKKTIFKPLQFSRTYPRTMTKSSTYVPRLGDYDTSYPAPVRQHNRTYGLIPPSIETVDIQLERCLKQLARKSNNIERYLYLSGLRNSNVHLFYRLVVQHIKDIAPLIYTPTVGQACQEWHLNYVQPEGLYISYADRGSIAKVLNNWPEKEVEISVITDGSRILGLGDLGINGMGIPIGKLALYISCAGISPQKALPLTLDLGTGNKSLKEDPLYMGSRGDKVSPAEELEFMDELMVALTNKWPGIIIQMEDFKNPWPALEKFREKFTLFNDDIQGTGAVIAGGLASAIKQSGTAVRDQRLLFFGAGSAGVGVARQIVQLFMQDGLTEDEARQRFWLLDSRGLITKDRGDKLAPHKVYFSRDDNARKQYQTLEEVVDLVKPTILMGLSTIGDVFTPQILKKMASWNTHPIIFPLSNPSANSECTFEDAIKYTNGKALFASGSPFPDFEFGGKQHVPGQGNNMYIFPGLGLGAIVCKATTITDSMIDASATSLAASLLPSEISLGLLYPDLARIRDVSVAVAIGVVRAAQKAGVDLEASLRDMGDEELRNWVKSRMYDPFLDSQTVENGVTGPGSGLQPSHL